MSRRPASLVLLYLDPGLTTGAALLLGDAFTSWQADFTETGHRVEDLAAEHGGRLLIGWEDYRVVGRGGNPTYSLKTIGMVEWLAYRHGAVPLPPRASADRKLGREDWLKALGWWSPGRRHADDAAMHLLAHLLREDWLTAPQRDRLFTQ